MTPVRRWAPWGLMAAVLAVSLVVGVGGDRDEAAGRDRVREVAASVRCPTCQGQSALESASPAAEAIRTEIARRVAEGQSDEEIRAYLVDRYGPSILLTPPSSGVGGLVWALPVVAVVLVAAGLTLAFARWRRRRPTLAGEADQLVVEQARRRLAQEER